MFRVRSLIILLGLSGFAAAPSFGSLIRDAFSPGAIKAARDNRPQRLAHHTFGTSPGAPDNSYSSSTPTSGAPTSANYGNSNDPGLPYMPPPSWLTIPPKWQTGYGWGSDDGHPTSGAFSWQPGGNTSKADGDGPDFGGGDPPNPSAYLSDPPPGMLNQTPEPVGLVYAALGGLLIGGVIRTLRGKSGWLVAQRAKEF